MELGQEVNVNDGREERNEEAQERKERSMTREK